MVHNQRRRELRAKNLQLLKDIADRKKAVARRRQERADALKYKTECEERYNDPEYQAFLTECRAHKDDIHLEDVIKFVVTVLSVIFVGYCIFG